MRYLVLCHASTVSAESGQLESRKIMRVIIAEKNSVVREDSISATPRRNYPLRVAITIRILWFQLRWLLSIDAAVRLPASVQSVLRFIVGGTKAGTVRHDGRAYKCRRRRRRADVKIVIFDFRSYFFDAGDKPARYRRVRGKSDETPTTSVGRSTDVRRDRSGYAIVGYWTLIFFFASTAACPDCALQSWFGRASKCAKIVHLSVVSYHASEMYEF